MTTQEQFRAMDRALARATPIRSEQESRVVFAIMDELSNQCMGHELTERGAGSRDDGCIMVNVSGPIDLVALARAAMRALEAD